MMAWPVQAAAADEETQFWIDGNVSYDLGDGFAASVQIQPRIQLDDTANDQLFLRAGLDYRVSDFVQIGGGMITLGEYDPTEVRPYNYVNLGNGPLTARTMAEFRFFDEADQMELRIRQRVQLSQPISDSSTNILVSGELFYTAQTREEGGEDRVTQWRLIAGVTNQLNDNLQMQLYYLALGIPREGEDALAHIPTLGINYRF